MKKSASAKSDKFIKFDDEAIMTAYTSGEHLPTEIPEPKKASFYDKEFLTDAKQAKKTDMREMRR